MGFSSGSDELATEFADLPGTDTPATDVAGTLRHVVASGLPISR